MSSEPSHQTGDIEETKQHIRAVLAELSQLAKTDITPEEFHAEFLCRVVASMAAVAGAVWIFDPRGGLTLSYQINLQAIDIRGSGEGEKQHSRLLYRLLEGPEGGTLVPAHSGYAGPAASANNLSVAVEGGEAGNPTATLIVSCPIRTELETVGLVEIFQRPDTSPGAQRGFVRFLAQSCLLATDYYKNRQLRHFGNRQSLWTLLEEFTRSIHRSLDVRQTAFTIVNEGRRLIECDRVSLAVRRGGRCVIESISGQDMIDKRSAPVRLLGRLATAVVRSDEPIWYSGDTSDFAPQVEKAINAYVDQSHTKLLAVFPLSSRLALAATGNTEAEAEREENRAPLKKRHRPFAALIVEQIEAGRLTESLRRRSEIVAEHASSALGNAIDHHGIFLMPLWKWIGKSKILVAARNLPKTLAVLVLVVAIILTMIFLPWRYRMNCTGKLEPRQRQKIYSPLDAEVRQVFVDHDSKVEGPKGDVPGTLLARLYSPDLESEGMKLIGEGREIEEQIVSLDRQIANEDKKLSPAEITQLQSQLDDAEIRQETNRRRWELHLRQCRELEIVSPMNGVVVTWDVEKNLRSRPIGRMQFLMEIVDPQGDWVLELSMPEKKMGAVIDTLKAKQAVDPYATLDVEFILATHPNMKHRGAIERIQDRAEVRTDTGAAAGAAPGGINTVLIRVRLNDLTSLPDSLRPGSECTANVECGTAPLGYVLFRDLYAFFQKNVLFRWF